MTLIIHAPNIHQGGGLVLLQALLVVLTENDNCKIIIDNRFPVPQTFQTQNVALRVKPTFIGRLRAEWKLYRMATNNTVVLCFGNLPPLLKSKGHVCLFIQNVYLVSKASLADFPRVDKLRIYFERLWLRYFINQADEVIVQTPSMQRLISKNLAVLSRVMPFIHRELEDASTLVPDNRVEHEKMFDFLYVASGEPHKNHRVLIEAWKILASKNIFPSLCLTIPYHSNPKLYTWLESQVTVHKLRIQNMGSVDREQVHLLYLQTKALIYPSLLESLGLPLIEAHRAGLPIVASELDYVRDIVDPAETFNPESSVSIARAVERTLGIAQKHVCVTGADSFITYLLKKAQI